jgi:hypothetical protein
VRQVCVDDTGAEILITVGAHPDADIGLELYSATERCGLMADALGLPVRIEAAPTTR